MNVQLKKRIVPIVFAFDRNYQIAAAVALTSLLVNASDSTYYDVHLLSNDLDGAAQFHFNRYEQKYSHLCKINIYNPKDAYARAPNRRYLTTPNYYRFLMPDLLEKYDKAIWCDVDVVIRTDLSHLLEIEMNDNYLIAVRELLLSSYRKEYAKQVGVDNEKYFNAGFCVWNLRLMRAHNSIEKLNKIIYDSNNKFLTPTQDPMNIVFQDNTMFIGAEYNFTVYSWILSVITDKKKYLEPERTINRIKDALKGIKILHFNGPDKPWTNYFYPFGKEWRKYFKESFLSNQILQYNDVIASDSEIDEIYQEEIEKICVYSLYLKWKEQERENTRLHSELKNVGATKSKILFRFRKRNLPKKL